MGVVYIKRPTESSMLGLWRLTESVNELFDKLDLSESDNEVYQTKKTDIRRKEWLAIRNLLENMLSESTEIRYDENGVPHLTGDKYHISMSHSGEYVCVYLDRLKKVGIDVQKLKKTIKAGADFFLNKQELDWINLDDNELLHIIWSAKETIYKYGADRELDMKKDMTTTRFDRNQKGQIEVTISTPGRQEKVSVDYELFEEYVLAKTS